MHSALLTEEDLHAYLDGELAEDRHALVEAHLAEHPEDTARLQAYRADGEAIARLFSRAEHLPDTSFSPRKPQPRAVRPWRGTAAALSGVTEIPWQRAAAIALIVATAVVAGLLGLRRQGGDEALWAQLGRDAIVAHLSLRHSGSESASTASLQDVSDFLSQKPKTPIQIRDPSTLPYRLVSSKFVVTGNGRFAQLAFRNGDKLVTMFMTPWPGKEDAPFREVTRQGGVVTMVWVDDQIGCAVSGNLPPAELERVARSLYDALIG